MDKETNGYPRPDQNRSNRDRHRRGKKGDLRGWGPEGPPVLRPPTTGVLGQGTDAPVTLATPPVGEGPRETVDPTMNTDDHHPPGSEPESPTPLPSPVDESIESMVHRGESGQDCKSRRRPTFY